MHCSFGRLPGLFTYCLGIHRLVVIGPSCTFRYCADVSLGLLLGCQLPLVTAVREPRGSLVPPNLAYMDHSTSP
ncbi:hypothetical protein Lal_00030351 [Lupinus albus]|nr:hypothetical protein Lal_00030351 [Lupinus albus]